MVHNTLNEMSIASKQFYCLQSASTSFISLPILNPQFQYNDYFFIEVINLPPLVECIATLHVLANLYSTNVIDV